MRFRKLLIGSVWRSGNSGGIGCCESIRLGDFEVFLDRGNSKSLYIGNGEIGEGLRVSEDLGMIRPGDLDLGEEVAGISKCN